jgi:hypothetical protein
MSVLYFKRQRAICQPYIYCCPHGIEFFVSILIYIYCGKGNSNVK